MHLTRSPEPVALPRDLAAGNGPHEQRRVPVDAAQVEPGETIRGGVKNVRVRRAWAAVMLAISVVMVAFLPPLAFGASTVNAPLFAPTPTSRTMTSISVRFYRSPEPDRVCKPDVGYEVRGGTFADWHDVGGLPNGPCDNPDPGYKFSGLTPATTYVLSIRAYRLVAGVKDSYSTESSTTASTLAPTPTPTASPPRRRPRPRRRVRRLRLPLQTVRPPRSWRVRRFRLHRQTVRPLPSRRARRKVRRRRLNRVLEPSPIG